MKKIILIASALLTYFSGLTQPANWQVDPADYTNQMFVSAQITGRCASDGDFLAVFDENDVIRGISEVGTGDNLFYLSVRSDKVNNEVLHFRYFDTKGDVRFTLSEQTFIFSKNFLLGFPQAVNVHVPELEAPEAICMGFNAYLDSVGVATLTPQNLDGGSVDNCVIDSMFLDKSSFTCSDIGAELIQLTVIDGFENSSSCNALVTVLDTIRPTAVCHHLEVFFDFEGVAMIIPEDIGFGTNDNCSIQSLELSKSTFTIDEPQQQEVVLTVTDNSGNESICSAIVTLLSREENTLQLCSDGIDNDGDGLVDCSDPDCPKPNIDNIVIGVPTSTSCISSDQNGTITLDNQSAQLFSIDGGVTFQESHIFSSLFDGLYSVVLRDTMTGCESTTEVHVENVHALQAIATDVELDCEATQGVFLTVDVINNSASFSQVWTKDGEIVNPTIRHFEGTYIVSVQDNNGCMDIDTAFITRAPYPESLIPPSFVNGPRVLCPGSGPVDFIANTNMLEGTIEWTYTGDGASLTTSSELSRVSLLLSESATPGDVISTFTGTCGSVTSTVAVSFADASTCATHANCVTDLNVNIQATNQASIPSFLNAKNDISIEGHVVDRQLVFKAGSNVAFTNIFEVENGSSISVNIGPCD